MKTLLVLLKPMIEFVKLGLGLRNPSLRRFVDDQKQLDEAINLTKETDPETCDLLKEQRRQNSYHYRQKMAAKVSKNKQIMDWYEDIVQPIIHRQSKLGASDWRADIQRSTMFMDLTPEIKVQVPFIFKLSAMLLVFWGVYFFGGGLLISLGMLLGSFPNEALVSGAQRVVVSLIASWIFLFSSRPILSAMKLQDLLSTRVKTAEAG